MAFKFLTTEDLETQMLLQFINERSEEALQAILDELEAQGIEIIKTKLKGRYDTNAIFAATGAERHHLIVGLLTTLVLYKFVRRNAARKVPADYKEDYDNAMKMLESIKAGKETPDGLPKPLDAQGVEVAAPTYVNRSNKDFYI